MAEQGRVGPCTVRCHDPANAGSFVSAFHASGVGRVGVSGGILTELTTETVGRPRRPVNARRTDVTDDTVMHEHAAN